MPSGDSTQVRSVVSGRSHLDLRFCTALQPINAHSSQMWPKFLSQKQHWEKYSEEKYYFEHDKQLSFNFFVISFLIPK